VPHGELTANKWLNSIKKQKRRSNFDFFAKIAQISLPWQQIRNIRRTFCRVPHGELTAKNGSIPSRNKEEESI